MRICSPRARRAHTRSAFPLCACRTRGFARGRRRRPHTVIVGARPSQDDARAISAPREPHGGEVLVDRIVAHAEPGGGAATISDGLKRRVTLDRSRSRSGSRDHAPAGWSRHCSQSPAGLPRRSTGPSLVDVAPEVPPRSAPERSTHAFPRRQQLRRAAMSEDLVVHAIRLALGQDARTTDRRGPRRARSRSRSAQKAVDRADVRLFEVPERLVERGQCAAIAPDRPPRRRSCSSLLRAVAASARPRAFSVNVTATISATSTRRQRDDPEDPR